MTLKTAEKSECSKSSEPSENTEISETIASHENKKKHFDNKVLKINQ